MLRCSQILPNSIYCVTAEPFFAFNILWRIREVDRMCYTDDTLNVADAFGGRMRIQTIPMSAERVCATVSNAIGPDDWCDVFLLDGTYIRNIQRA